MKTLLLLLFSVGYAAAQACGTLAYNPITRRLDCIGPPSTVPTMSGALTLNAIVVGASASSIKTANTSTTIDSDGNLSTPGGLSGGVGGSAAGYFECAQGTAPTLGTNSVRIYCDTAVTAYKFRLPAAPATGFFLGTNTSSDVVTTIVSFTGTGDVVRATSPTLVTPNLGTPSAGVLTNATGLPHTVTCGADNGTTVLSTGDVHQYFTSRYSGTIDRIDISGCAWNGSSCGTGSITVDVWKAAGAIPVSGDKISGSAPLTITSSQLSQNGSRAGWTTAVSAGDVFACSIVSVTSLTSFVATIWFR
jgi:hypothetical protein